MQLGVAALEPGRVVGMAWTYSETLVVALDNGTVDVFDVLGQRTSRCFRFLPSQTREVIEAITVCGSGMAAVSRTHDGLSKLYLVYDLDAPAPVLARGHGEVGGVQKPS